MDLPLVVLDQALQILAKAQSGIPFGVVVLVALFIAFSVVYLTGCGCCGLCICSQRTLRTVSVAVRKVVSPEKKRRLTLPSGATIRVP
jgi:hypothetical protein